MGGGGAVLALGGLDLERKKKYYLSKKKVKTCTSISGGRTSAYLAANYPTDYNVFALVRTDDPGCKFPDNKLRQVVEDRIQKPFIGTLEDDLIITTILDLEQHLGKEISWVSGLTYDELIRSKGDYLPNKVGRYCTSEMKINPMFYWWAENVGEPMVMQIGFRANEGKRAKTMQDKTNKNGLLEFKATFGKNARGQNKWEQVEWQKPIFPLIENGIFKDHIQAYWDKNPVRFAPFNNCVGCFHRNPIFLRKMADAHPNKMEWFARQEEKERGGQWRSDVRYRDIIKTQLQIELSFDDFNECDSGYCGL